MSYELNIQIKCLAPLLLHVGDFKNFWYPLVCTWRTIHKVLMEYVSDKNSIII